MILMLYLFSNYKVAHIATVKDTREATIIAWHLGSAMDCVITKTSQSAAEVENESGENVELLSLDDIYLAEQSSWKKYK